MTKATKAKPIGDNVPLFKDPATGEHLPIGKVEAKEADGKPRGPHQTPASATSLAKLQAKFAKK